MEIVLFLIHIIVCFVLIMVVLLQSGKAADLAGAFGGGGSQTALGSRGAATVLSKATTICAVIFMLTSLGLALYGSRRSSSVLEQVKTPAQPASPATPEAAPGATPAAPAPTTAPATAPAGDAPQGGAGAPAGQNQAAPAQPGPAQPTPAPPQKPPGR